MKCFICQMEFNKSHGKHVYYCAKKHGVVSSNSDLRYKQICFQIGLDVTKHMMWKAYIENEYSLPDLKEEFGLDYQHSLFLLDYFGIPKRGKQEAASSGRTRSKYKSTCEVRYGVSNVSVLDEVKEAKRQTFLKHYGVDNIWKSSEFKEWIVQYMLNTYGAGSLSNRNKGLNEYWKSLEPSVKSERVRKLHEGGKIYWDSLTEDEKDAIIQKRCRIAVAHYDSSLENRVASALDQLGIIYSRQWWIARKSYDFLIKGSRIVIEVNGDYWHANPSLYKANDLFDFKSGEVLASSLWAKDDKKKQLAGKYGYSLVVIWEQEMNKLNEIALQELILCKLSDLRGEDFGRDSNQIYKED